MSEVYAHPAKESSALGAINQISLLIDLDELSEDSDERRLELFKLVKDAYAEEKKKFEESHDDIQKNGTYFKKYILLDPIDGKDISMFIVMQRYKYKADQHTETFFGSIFLPHLPYLVSQVITILSEWEEIVNSHSKGAASEKLPTLLEYCQSWGITPKLYRSFFRRIKAWYSALSGDLSRSGFQNYLHSLCYR